MPKYIFIFVLFMMPTTYAADSGKPMKNMFNQMINTTDPAIIDSQRRGIISLGSMQVRNQITKPTLISFNPPRIDAGCGGIDAFGGSFSFISADEFIETLRNIAGNASGYAFGLALKAMCPSCDDEIKALQNIINRINGQMRDSCQFAQLAVQSSPFYDFALEKKKEQALDIPDQLQVFGNIDDWLVKNVDKKSKEEADKATDTDTQINTVWAALKRSDTAKWISGGDDTFLELLMSITGTYVISSEKINSATGAREKCKTVKEGTKGVDNGGERDDYCTNDFPSLITITDFMDKASVDKSVKVYKCNDSDKCLYPTQKELTTASEWPGISVMVHEVLFGVDVNNNSGNGHNFFGLVNKIRMKNDPNGRLTDAEKGFISAAPAPVWYMIKASAKSPGLMNSVAHQLEHVISFHMASALIEELIRSVRQSIKIADIKQKKSVLDEIERIRAQIDSERKNIQSQQDAIMQIISNFEDVKKALYAQTAKDKTNLQTTKMSNEIKAR